MKKNIGTKDRFMRACIAAILFIFAGVYQSWLFFLGASFVLFEVSMSWCIFYQLIGKNTCSLKKKE